MDWKDKSRNNFRYDYSRSAYYCLKCGATVFETQDAVKHDNWHTEIEKGINVSNVKWCDPGDHAFKATEPGAGSFTGQQIDEQGMPVTLTMDVCGRHSGRIFATPEQVSNSRMREVENAYKQESIDGHFTD